MEWDDGPIDHEGEFTRWHRWLDELGMVKPGQVLPQLRWTGNGDSWTVEDQGSTFHSMDFETAVRMVVARSKDRVIG